MASKGGTRYGVWVVKDMMRSNSEDVAQNISRVGATTRIACETVLERCAGRGQQTDEDAVASREPEPVRLHKASGRSRNRRLFVKCLTTEQDARSLTNMTMSTT